MKELYEGLELEVVRFGGEDVITASAEDCAKDEAEECAEDIESIIDCKKDTGDDCGPDCDPVSYDDCSVVTDGCSDYSGDI